MCVGEELGKCCSCKDPGTTWWSWQTPFFSWQISSVLQDERPNSYLQHFLSLQHSFLCCVFVIVLGAGCFLLTALHLERDQAQARQSGRGTPTPCSTGQAPGWTLLDWEHW